MVSGHTGNVVPRKGLRVRAPCPPLLVEKNHKQAENALFTGFSAFFVGFYQRPKPVGPEGHAGTRRDPRERFHILRDALHWTPAHFWGVWWHWTVAGGTPGTDRGGGVAGSSGRRSKATSQLLLSGAFTTGSRGSATSKRSSYRLTLLSSLPGVASRLLRWHD